MSYVCMCMFMCLIIAWCSSIHCETAKGTNDRSSGKSEGDWGEKQTLSHTSLSITMHIGIRDIGA